MARRTPSTKKTDDLAAAALAAAAPAKGKDIYEALFGELVKKTQAAAPAGTKVTVSQKVAYVRLNLDGKTLIYFNRPTSKGVRVEIPKDGGYDKTLVTTEKEGAKLIAAAYARLASKQAKAASAKDEKAAPAKDEVKPDPKPEAAKPTPAPEAELVAS